MKNKLNIFSKINQMKVKDKLIEQINKIENEELMNSISSMISNLNESGILELGPQTIKELDNRSENISKGEFVAHEEVVKKFNK